MLIFEAGIAFHLLPSAAILFACWKCVVQELSFSNTQHTTMTILKSSFPSHSIDASKNLFHSGIDFLQGIDSMDSVPGFLKRRVVNVITTPRNYA
jgi:hypothetical protein